MLDRMFLKHPRDLGETYWAHQRIAFALAGALLLAAIASAIHGLVPALFKTTAGRAVARLHQQGAFG